MSRSPAWLAVLALICNCSISHAAAAQTERTGRAHIRAAVVGADTRVIPVPLCALQLLSTSDSAIRVGMRTSLDGVVEVEVPAGSYRVVSPAPATVGDRRYRWDVPVQVPAGGAVAVELTGTNATTETARALRPKPSGVLGWHPTDRGVMRISGGAGLDFTRYTSFDAGGAPQGSPSTTRSGSISATVEVLVVNGLALGLSASFSRFTSKQTVDSSSFNGNTSGYSLGPSLTWFLVPRARAVLPYVHVAAAVGKSTDHYSGVGSYGVGTQTYADALSSRDREYTAAAGVILMFAPQVGADVALEYFDRTSRISSTSSYSYPGYPDQTSTTTGRDKSNGVRVTLGLAVFVRP